MHLSFLVWKSIVRDRIREGKTVREKLWCHSIPTAMNLFIEQGTQNEVLLVFSH